VIKKYRVLFQGLLGDKNAFKARMIYLGAPPETVDRMIQEAPVILKGDLSLGDARQYADTVQEAGGRVMIQEHGYSKEPMRTHYSNSIVSLKDFTMCPECGLKQPKGEICGRCGLRLNSDDEEHRR
jgi:hypothetical protein